MTATSIATVPKLLKLGKKQMLWQSTGVILPDPYKKGFLEKRLSAEYILPSDCIFIQSIVIDGCPVYDASIFEVKPKTYMLGGGGRFVHKRRMRDKECVMQTLYLQDFKFKKRIEIIYEGVL